MAPEIPKKVELGCGKKKQSGWYGVDIADTAAVNLVQDLDEENWELPSSHFEEIRAIDVFEHLRDPINFMEEVYRISKDGCQVVIQGPHFSSGNWHDPTHRRLLGSRSFEHFTDETRFEFYSDGSFEVVDKEITFEWTSIPGYEHLASYIANRHTMAYERTFLRNLFPATNIRFELRVRK